MMATPQKNENGTYFAAIAENYDRIQPVIAGPAYELGLNGIIDLIPHVNSNAFQFVELGCGTAELSARVLERFPYTKGTSIDSEPVMLAIARKKLYSHGQRGEIIEDDMTACVIPACDVIISAKAFHHVHPDRLKPMLSRVAEALAPSGCFILFDGMSAGPKWDENVRKQSRLIYQRHVDQAIITGKVTQEEIDARWSFKRKMKAEGKDTEYRHRSEDILKTMEEVGFGEVGLVWRLFEDTILVGFTFKEH